jgi:hypothetical protein
LVKHNSSFAWTAVPWLVKHNSSFAWTAVPWLVQTQFFICMNNCAMLGANTCHTHLFWLYKQAVRLTFWASWEKPSFVALMLQ